MAQQPDFDSIKQTNVYGIEYWSARDLAPLLGYNRWERFEVAIQRAITACQQTEQLVENHFPASSKMVSLGSGSQRELKDYYLSRFACYLCAQNGDPRKPEIAAAQAYFAISTRENELHRLREEQEKRLQLRERVAESNTKLTSVAQQSGVQSRNFGIFHNAGYTGMYTLDVEGIRERKRIDPKEDILDVMGRAELAANEFRITQTESKLIQQGALGESAAINTHFEVGKEVREAIQRIGGTMPEDLPSAPNIRKMVEGRRRKAAKKSAGCNQTEAAHRSFARSLVLKNE
jgi:DNA-damage-inducible protein D